MSASDRLEVGGKTQYTHSSNRINTFTQCSKGPIFTLATSKNQHPNQISTSLHIAFVLSEEIWPRVSSMPPKSARGPRLEKV